MSARPLRRYRSLLCLSVTAVATILLAVVALGTGAIELSPSQVIDALFATDASGELARYHAVVVQIRLPRIIMGLLVGAALATSGGLLQGLLRNPLADPAILGVSSGAALGAATAIVAMAGVTSALDLWAVPITAVLGAALTTLLVYRVGRGPHGFRSERLILAGVAVNALAAAGIGLMLDIADDNQLRSLTAWTLGALSGTTWSSVLVCSVSLALTLPFALTMGAHLNALLLGQREAGFLGVAVRPLANRIVGLSAVMVGVATSFVGIVGFVGLVVPHLVRLALGADHRTLLPMSALTGGALLIASDLVARTVVAPRELPLGVLTSLLGAPFFLWLIMRNRAVS